MRSITTLILVALIAQVDAGHHHVSSNVVEGENKAAMVYYGIPGALCGSGILGAASYFIITSFVGGFDSFLIILASTAGAVSGALIGGTSSAALAALAHARGTATASKVPRAAVLNRPSLAKTIGQLSDKVARLQGQSPEAHPFGNAKSVSATIGRLTQEIDNLERGSMQSVASSTNLRAPVLNRPSLRQHIGRLSEKIAKLEQGAASEGSLNAQLLAQILDSRMGISAAALIGLFTISGVTFAMICFRHVASRAKQEPLLGA